MISVTKKVFLVLGALCILFTTCSYASGKREGDLRREGKLKPGDAAPEIDLKSPDGKTSFKLSSFKGKKPVVLVFGSYT